MVRLEPAALIAGPLTTPSEAPHVAEVARQAEKPALEPWEAWRKQKAPEMFEAEVTNRG